MQVECSAASAEESKEVIHVQSHAARVFCEEIMCDARQRSSQAGQPGCIRFTPKWHTV